MRKREKAEFNVLKRIEEERIKRQWTEYTLAKNSGIPQSTISTWNRKQLEPSIASIEKICSGLGLSLAQFFSDDSVEGFLSPEQSELLNLWLELTKEQRQAVIALLRAMQDRR